MDFFQGNLWLYILSADGKKGKETKPDLLEAKRILISEKNLKCICEERKEKEKKK